MPFPSICLAHWLTNAPTWHSNITEWHCRSLANKYSYLAVAPCIHMTVFFTGYQIQLSGTVVRMALCLTGYLIQLSGTMVTQNDIVPHWLPNTAIWHPAYREWHCVLHYRPEDLAPQWQKMTLSLISYLIQNGTVSYTTGRKIWHHSDRKWHWASLVT